LTLVVSCSFSVIDSMMVMKRRSWTCAGTNKQSTGGHELQTRYRNMRMSQHGCQGLQSAVSQVCCMSEMHYCC
jgi:hypothetical protein